MILVVDNYDSFTYNLVQALGQLGAEIQVSRNDAVSIEDVHRLRPAGIVLSPGPGRPEGAGCCMDLVREFGASVPLLGVCLGHQAIGAALGAAIVHAPAVVHGKTAAVSHSGRGIFTGLSQPVVAARYHSLVVAAEGLPEVFEVEATAAGGLIMGMAHRTWPVFGVQFHPESIATPEGPRLLANFLRLTGGGPC